MKRETKTAGGCLYYRGGVSSIVCGRWLWFFLLLFIYNCFYWVMLCFPLQKGCLVPNDNMYRSFFYLDWMARFL